MHTIVHHSSTSTYTPNFSKIKETFCGQTDGRRYVSTHGRTFETGFISQPKNENNSGYAFSMAAW